MLVSSLFASKPGGILFRSEPGLEAFVELLLIGDISVQGDELVVVKQFKDVNCDSITFESSLPVHKFSLQVHKSSLLVHEVSLQVHKCLFSVHESSFSKINIVASPQGGWLE